MKSPKEIIDEVERKVSAYSEEQAITRREQINDIVAKGTDWADFATLVVEAQMIEQRLFYLTR